MNCNKNSELKTNSPRPMLGEENSQFELLRKLENLVRVHSDYYKYCHSVLDTESEVGEWTNTNENISLLPMKWEKMSERQMRVNFNISPHQNIVSSTCAIKDCKRWSCSVALLLYLPKDFAFDTPKHITFAIYRRIFWDMYL